MRSILMKHFLIILISFSFTAFLCAEEKKNILIIFGKSSHDPGSHNNKEVAHLIEKRLTDSHYAEKLDIQMSHNYPKDLQLVENADLVIISSDGGPKHALADKSDPVKNMKHLDSVLKKNKTGLIIIHWATDAPSGKFGHRHVENADLMIDWIGAVYFWEREGKKLLPSSSWTWKFPVLDLKVDKSHPISNGLPETFKLQDEYYLNFFTEGEDSRTPKTDRVTFLHSAVTPSEQADQNDTEEKKNWRIQPVFWAYDREDGGRSVAMTSAHMYHTWANPHFYKSFTNSILWTLGLEVPENGANLPTPTLEDLQAMDSKVRIHQKALHFK